MSTDVMTTAIGQQGHQSVVGSENNGCKSEVSEAWKKNQSQQNVNNHAKKGHRRKPSKRKRKWKPYSKMSWEERKALDEKEKHKAVRLREEMKEKGRPVAPYNTTQFLMEEHDPHEGGFEPTGYGNSNASAAGTDDGESYSDEQDELNDSSAFIDGSDEEEQITAYTDSPHMVSEFISQDFSETYERVHEESLTTMSREELLKDHMDLEQKFNQLQEQLSKTKRALEAKVRDLEDEKEQMRQEINSLTNQNESLKSEQNNSRASVADDDLSVKPPRCEKIKRR